MLSIQFLVTSLIVVMVPGTGTLYTVSAGVTRGWKTSIAAAIGCTLGIVPHLVASALGLSAIMNMGAHVFSVVKMAGAAYLVYLAWAMWRDGGSFAMEGGDDERRFTAVVGRGIALNLLNPKLTIFFLAFLPHFVLPGASEASQMASLSAVFMGMTFVVFCAYGIIASWAGSLFQVGPTATRWVRRSFAVAFAGLAVELAFTDR